MDREPPQGFSQLPTSEIKLAPAFIQEVKQVAPKKRHPVLLYALVGVGAVGGALLIIPATRHRILSRQQPTPTAASATATADEMLTVGATASIAPPPIVSASASASAPSASVSASSTAPVVVRPPKHRRRPGH